MGMVAMLAIQPGPFEQFSFSQPLEATPKIGSQSACEFQRRSHLKLLTEGGQSLAILKAPPKPFAQVS